MLETAGPRARLRSFVLGGLALACAAAAAAQLPAPAPAPTPAAQVDDASDPYGRDTPHGCFFGFLRTSDKGSYANAAEYLQIPSSLRPKREQIAAQFQEVLDQRFVSTSLERISRSPRGALEDGLPPNVERVGEILGPEGSFDVLLVRHEAAGAPPVWLISWETIREARRVYGELGAPVVAQQLPAFLVQTRVGPLRLWQIVAFLVLLPVLYGLSWLLVGAVLALAHLLRRKPGGQAGEWTSAARSPITLLIAVLVHRVAVFWLGIPVMLADLLQPVPVRPAAADPAVDAAAARRRRRSPPPAARDAGGAQGRWAVAVARAPRTAGRGVRAGAPARAPDLRRQRDGHARGTGHRRPGARLRGAEEPRERVRRFRDPVGPAPVRRRHVPHRRPARRRRGHHPLGHTAAHATSARW